MDIFKDSKYEQFDELTQLIEPFIFIQNDIIRQIPEVTPVTIDDLMKLKQHHLSGYIMKGDAFALVCSKAGLDHNEIPYEQRYDIQRLLRFKMEGAGYIDISGDRPVLYGDVSIVLIRGVYSDEEVRDLMCSRMKVEMHRNIGRSGVPAARFAELAESFGILDEMKRTPKHANKLSLISNTIINAIKDNSIRIRSYDLGVKFAEWVRIYLEHGNLAALKNIAMMKVMSHEGKAIYSITEEPV